MAIAAIDSVPTGYDVAEKEWDFSSGRLTAWNSPLVRVETDDGRVGWGEANAGFQNAEDVAGVIERVEHAFLGESAADVDVLVERARRAHLGRYLAESVVGAVGVACYDVLGQARGVPVYELLGGAGTDGSFRAYGSGGLGASVDQRADQAVSFADEGFDTVKVRGMATTDGTLDLIDRIVEATDGVTVAVDGTGNDGLDDVLALVERMNEYDEVAWFEDPVPSRQNLEGYRRVREAADFPVTGMESCVGIGEFRRALEYDCVDLIHPDASRGGYGHLRRVSALAGSHGVPLVNHVWGGGVTLLANAHFAAADPNCRMIEYCRLENPLREGLFAADLDRDGMDLALPDVPGLGLDVPDDVAERYPYREGTGHVGFD